MSQNQIDILQRALNREKLGRKQAESILEEKSGELYNLTLQLKESNLKLEKLVTEKTSELKGVFENIIDAYVVIDLYGNTLKMNDAAVSLLGFSDLNEKINLLDLLHPNEIDRTAVAFKKLLKDGSLTDFDVKIITKEAVQKLVHINCSVIYKNGAPIAAQGIVRDITSDRMQAELIQEQKRQLDIIVDNSSFGIVLTQHGDIMKSNRAFQEMLGYTSEELDILTIKDVSHPVDIEESIKLISEMDSGNLDKFTVQKKYLKKNGSTIWAKTTVSAVRFLSGNIKYQVAIVEDITKERENNLMVEVINNVAKAILGKVNTYEIAWEIVNKIANYLGTDDCVIYILNTETNSLEQIAAFGQKVKGYNVIDKLSISLGEGIVGHVAKTGIAEIISDTRKDNRYIVDNNQRLSEITVPIISKEKVIGVIDSEHQENNYYNSKHLETLSNIARIVSMQLDNALSLGQKQKAEEKNTLLLQALERSNVELQEYAHVVSHDLKSPLRSINALVSWLKEDNYDKFDESSMKNFDLIESTLENMEQLISDVLDYSSVASDSLTEEMVDLNEVIMSIIEDLQPSSDMSIEILNDLPNLKGDKIRYKQLFQNLISNAVKHNDKEKGIVLIDYSKNKTHHKFSIKDNGMGIEKKYFEKIFEIFQSLHVSAKATGIGLAIVKKIVDLYKGDIWLESELGKGTTFYFTIKK